MEQAQAFAAHAKTQWQRFVAWVTREEHKQRARELRSKVEHSFTEHPHETGETYIEHLWFTVRLAGRLFYSASAVLLHGIFPFLLKRTASQELERIYSIMKKRGPRLLSGQDWTI